MGDAIRRDGVATVAHAQAAAGAVGMSCIDPMPYLPATFAPDRVPFSGVDARWMKSGVQLRGEWLWGQPFDGTTTDGGYIDPIGHRAFMGPVTALARAERPAYAARAPFDLYTHRYRGGAKVVVWKGLTASAGVGHQEGEVTQTKATALDAAISISLRGTIRRRE